MKRMKIKDFLSQMIIWNKASDPEFPYKAVHNDVDLTIRLNNFPAESLYTLVVGNSSTDFDDWPKLWKKSATNPSKAKLKKHVMSSISSRKFGYTEKVSGRSSRATASGSVKSRQSSSKLKAKTVS